MPELSVLGVTEDASLVPVRFVAPRQAEEMRTLLVGFIAIVALSAMSLCPLLFHSAAEVFFAVVAVSILAIAWHLRPLVDDHQRIT